jgi:hypothetical protein
VAAPSAETGITIAEESASGGGANSISGEIAALREAEEALRAGQPDRALRALDRYETAGTPSGALEEERRAARIIAACASNPNDRARAEQERFLRERPTSPLAARVREACSKKSTR